MGREIITERDTQLQAASANAPDLARAAGEPPPPPPPTDEYLTKLMKYIPGDVVSLYVALEAIVATTTKNADDAKLPSWIIFFVCLVGTPLYLWKIGKVSMSLQLCIATLAFAVWVFALGGPFECFAWYASHKVYPEIGRASCRERV